MERKFNVKGILCLAMAMASVAILPSCGDDDNTPNPTDPKQIAGDYKGEMVFTANAAGTPDTVKIEKSVVTTDTIAFAKFPVKDLIIAITSEDIANALGIENVEYKVGYTVDASAATDSTLAMKLEPKELQLILPKAEGQEKSDTVFVAIAGEKAVYGIKKSNLGFGLKVEKVTMSSTGDLNLLPKPLDLTFNLNK